MLLNISISDVKTLLQTTTTGWDSVIERKLEAAEMYVLNSINMTVSGSDFQEKSTINQDNEFMTMSKYPVTLNTLTVYASANTEVVVTTGDYSEYTKGVYKFTDTFMLNNPIWVLMEYTDTRFANALCDITLDLAYFEFMKTKKEDNSLTRENYNVGQMMAGKFKADADFYRSIEDRINRLVIRNV